MSRSVFNYGGIFLPAGLLLSTCLFFQCSKPDQATTAKYPIDKTKAAAHVVSAGEINDFKTTLAARIAALPQGRLASGTLHLTPSTYFPVTALRDLLHQPGVAGIHIYTGRQTDGSTTLFMVAADAGKKDIPGNIQGPAGSMELATARTLSSSFRTSTASVNNLNLPADELFNRDAIELLIQRPEVAGVRIYWGSTSGKGCMILLPVNAAGNDMHISLLREAAADTTGGDGLEKGTGDPTGGLITNP
ncbi:hypothetical protein [Chitinophaga sp. Cy-1792]|uniref:hypothetical protein n=1 Tax=Chitinophaga sp. Cy-1792 TaxID=2608339 RepID=UPI001423C9B1|nr:hypothetical protein [Chitinophaga sp. Cy-1792]NIG56436.1 hypothetical protein [Chitinophaga sp. Cy-1792]